MMKVAVIGTGYVGLPTGVGLAELGNRVVCVDKLADKINKLNRGELTLYEDGLEELFKKNVAAGALSFTRRFVMSNIPVALVTGGSRGIGRAAAEELARYLNGYTVVATKSTVPVGTGDEVEKIIRKVNPKADFDVVSLPEFLREGFAIHDFFNPDRIVIGTENDKARDVMLELYRPFAGKSEFLCVKRRSSETIKYASNAFLAMKIHYINEMADFCECAGADIREVAKGMGLDSRIGKKFLNPGPGYGGSCFPKDTNAMAQMGKKFGAHLTLIETTIAQNDARKARMGQRVIEAVKEHPEGKIAVLGLAFKGGTDDCRESPAIDIIKEMIKYSRNITVYDPKALENAKSILNNTVQYAESVDEACRDAEVAVILTEWEDFKHLDLERLKKIMRRAKIVDMRNMLCGDAVKEAGFDYQCVGRKK